jgi:hypothetical protein
LKHLIRGGSAQTFDVLNRKWIVGRDGEVYHYQYFNPRTRELEWGSRCFEFDPDTHTLARRVYATQATFELPCRRARGSGPLAGQPGMDAVVRAEGPVRPSSRSTRPRSLEASDYFVTEVPEPAG